jgi:hypothetical protein
VISRVEQLLAVNHPWLEWLSSTSAGGGWPGTRSCGGSVSKIGDRGPTPKPQGVMCGLP